MQVARFFFSPALDDQGEPNRLASLQDVRQVPQAYSSDRVHQPGVACPREPPGLRERDARRKCGCYRNAQSVG
ncbi:hypothetical protein PC116_g19088 [Phytophthora cactorum]|nr:hypothetical protein PC116_g19088 [Phytophthora cactorum]